MKAAWMAIAALLAGCSTRPDEPKSAATDTACNIGRDLIGHYVGRSYSDDLGTDLQHRSRSAVLRVVRPGDTVTADFRADRITIQLTEQGSVGSANCG